MTDPLAHTVPGNTKMPEVARSGNKGCQRNLLGWDESLLDEGVDLVVSEHRLERPRVDRAFGTAKGIEGNSDWLLKVDPQTEELVGHCSSGSRSYD